MPTFKEVLDRVISSSTKTTKTNKDNTVELRANLSRLATLKHIGRKL